MRHRRSTRIASLGGAFALVAIAAVAHADPVTCQKQVIKTLAAFKKISLTAPEKCLDKENQGKLPGPCPDAATQLKIQKKSTAATACTSSESSGPLGFVSKSHSRRVAVITPPADCLASARPASCV